MKIGLRSKRIPENINAGILNGNVAVLAYLKTFYYPIVVKLLKRMNSSNAEEDAKDIFADVMAIIYHNLLKKKIIIYRDHGELVIENNNNGKRSKLKTYFYGIARNTWTKSHLNPGVNLEIHGSDSVEKDMEDSSYQADECIINAERYQYWNTKLKLLEPRCRLLISLHVKSGFSHKTISGLMGLSHGTIRNLFSRCWSNLLGTRTIEDSKNIHLNKEDEINVTKISHSIEMESQSDTEPDIDIIRDFLESKLSSEVERNVVKSIEKHAGCRELVSLHLSLISFFNEKFMSTINLHNERIGKPEPAKKNNLAELCFSRLNNQCKLILLLYFVSGEKCDEITKMLELDSDKNTKTSINDCMKKLKNISLKEGLINNDLSKQYLDGIRK